MTQKIKKELKPKLRFPEFRDEPGWDTSSGDDLFDSIKNTNAPPGLPVLAITQEHGAIPRDMIDYHVSVTEKSVESYKEVLPDDFIISLRSFQGGIEYSNYHGICSPAYVILRKKRSLSTGFYKQLFKTSRFIRQMTKNLEGLRDGKMISYKQFSELDIPEPSPAEQILIAECLCSLDELFAAHERKLELLKDYKKGLMQSLFPRPGENQPRLRFPEFQDGPEWSEKLLGHLGNFHSSLTGKSAKDFDTGSATFITYMNVFSNTFTNINDRRAVDVSSEESQNTVAKGDVFFTVSSETPEDAGMSSVLLEDIPNCYLNSFCALFRFDDGKSPYPLFLGFLLRSAISRKQLSHGAQGATRYNISKSTFRNLSLRLPSSDEQKKIAHCLCSLDKLFADQAKKVNALKAHKKGLLQQLFPSAVTLESSD